MFIYDLYVVFSYKSQISGERLHDHWSSGLSLSRKICRLVIGPAQTQTSLGPVVQSSVSLTASLRRQFVKYMLTTYANTSLFCSIFVKKIAAYL